MAFRTRIVKYPNESLRTPIPPLDVIDHSVVDVAWDISRKLPFANGYALAANQLGHHSPMFGYLDGKKTKFIVNPQITEYSSDMYLFDEGCLSIPNFYFPIERPRTVLVKGFDLDGNPIELEASDLLGRIMQHEIDHINGKLVVDLLDDEQREEFTRKWESFIKNLKTQTVKKRKKKK